MDREIVRKLPGSLLARYLRVALTAPNHLQFYDWLELSFNYGSQIRDKHKQFIQDWLSRPFQRFQGRLLNMALRVVRRLLKPKSANNDFAEFLITSTARRNLSAGCANSL